MPAARVADVQSGHPTDQTLPCHLEPKRSNQAIRDSDKDVKHAAEIHSPIMRLCYFRRVMHDYAEGYEAPDRPGELMQINTDLLPYNCRLIEVKTTRDHEELMQKVTKTKAGLGVESRKHQVADWALAEAATTYILCPP